MDKAARLLAFILAIVTSGCGGMAKTPGLKETSPSAFGDVINTCTAVSCEPALELVGNTHSTTETKITLVDGLNYPYTTAGLLAAISDAGTGGRVIIAQSAVISVTTMISLLSRQTVACYPGATLNLNVAAAHSVQVTGVADVRISGCTFNWQSGSTDAIAVRNTATGVTIDNNTFTNFPATGAAAVIFVGDRSNSTVASGVSNVNVVNNVFAEFAGTAVNVQDNASHILIAGNDMSSANALTTYVTINAQTTDADTTISELTISGNHIWNGTAGDCVQVQQVSGNVIQTVLVEDNTCIWTARGNGFSSAGINGLTQANNLVDANGFGQYTSIGNAIFESANVTNSVERGNTAIMGEQSGSSPIVIFSVIAGNVTGTVPESHANVTFTDNGAAVAYTGSATLTCWYVGVTNAQGSVVRNNVIGNRCDFTGSTGTVAGIFVQTTSTSGLLSNNAIAHNTLIGNKVRGDCGICIENDAGTLDGNTIGLNEIHNFYMLYGSNFGGQVAAPPWPDGVTVASFAPTGSPPSDGGAFSVGVLP